MRTVQKERYFGVHFDFHAAMTEYPGYVRQGGRLFLIGTGFLNQTGRPLSVAIRYEKVPRRVLLEPGRLTCDYVYRDGKIRLNVNGVKVHEIIVVE